MIWSHSKMPPRRAIVELLTLSVGFVIHVVLLSLPMLLATQMGSRWGDRMQYDFLLLSSLVFLADASHCRFATTPSPIADADDQQSMLRLAWMTGTTMLGIFWVAQCEHLLRLPSPSTTVQCVGGALMLAGAMLRFLSIQTLGESFSTALVAADDRSLVTTGIFRFMRHPSETGILAVMIGAGILLQSWIAMGLIVVLLLPVILIRVIREERFLLAVYGERYRHYASKVSRFMPFLI